MFNEDFIPLSPVNFFQMKLNCRYLDPGTFDGKSCRKYLLPDTSDLCNDEHFTAVAIGWNQEGLEFFIKVDKPFEDCFYPEVDFGDSVELFVDTRDIKSSGFNTRFCHHFFFLPEPVDDNQKGEITRFRTEDTHELCSPDDLGLEVEIKKRKFTMNITIPKSCLYGYDPSQFDRIGFTYRINRPKWESQHFSVVTEEYQITNQPSLWASMRLVK